MIQIIVLKSANYNIIMSEICNKILEVFIKKKIHQKSFIVYNNSAYLYYFMMSTILLCDNTSNNFVRG